MAPWRNERFDGDMMDNIDDFDDFDDIDDDPIAVADQVEHLIGWMLEEGYSPLSIQSGLTMITADFAGYIFDTFEDVDDDDDDFEEIE